MLDFKALEPAIDPSNKITFLVDWELTMKCNLDCSYCGTGIDGGHDNTIPHPPLDECLPAIDFMFRYVDLYMNTKPQGIRYVILNVYGGESLYHPEIENILSKIKQQYQPYKDRWHLTITTTTNAIVSTKKLLKIIPFIDEFTVSYHSESTQKQKAQFQNNLLLIKQHKKRQKCVVLMHPDTEKFQDATDMIKWLVDNDIPHLPKQLDHTIKKIEFNYSKNQVGWFKSIYQAKNYNVNENLIENATVDQNNQIDLADTGRTCCGGRSLCKDADYKSRAVFVKNQFPDWSFWKYC